MLVTQSSLIVAQSLLAAADQRIGSLRVSVLKALGPVHARVCRYYSMVMMVFPRECAAAFPQACSAIADGQVPPNNDLDVLLHDSLQDLAEPVVVCRDEQHVRCYAAF